MKEANGGHNTADPKALNALLAEETFQRLISTFEYFLQRTQVAISKAFKCIPCDIKIDGQYMSLELWLFGQVTSHIKLFLGISLSGQELSCRS